ncbi:hypothetical protein I3843_06G040800 [Carya illinoinensis]|uniref:Uncharacterized protein n=1 Tax=Carya illinoinensis TaxID=32201 RepID=A0A8T1Q7T6_CARIL|nr:uncharacterized protein At4g00950-like [Carya illinoinensis]KAG2701431.1 hypothetical protein I3760_06G044500 [Carya illinoinensis]KAG6650466.1 hypothetical protein CIPAW_06G045500 [Carya illinoinensis]KAG6707701.1 hypothetical protein I3842_06G045100 [Carya illinoinensis]KAG7974278.1 hypothetical protein I3843_06G040800 [Carya illinoinensis]
MGSSEPEYEASSTPKLSLFSLPSKLLDQESTGMLTPPLRATASVPFHWEEAPGKPRQPCAADSKQETAARILELPPRLLLSESKSINMPSPTTVLDGPYVGRAVFHSHRFSFRSPDHEVGRRLTSKERGGHFGSMRWGSFRKNKQVFQGSFDFSSSAIDGDHDGGGTNTKGKITRVRRRGSFLSLANTSSHLLASVYESFKQVVPWRRTSARKNTQKDGLNS